MRASFRTISAFAAIALTAILLASPAISQSPYAPNVTAQQTNSVTVSSSGTATIDNTATTGVTASVSGATGVSGMTVITQSLNSPDTGVGAFSTSGSAAYFDVQVTFPTGTTAPAGATVQVCFTNPTVASDDVLMYYSGGAWVAATNVSVSGTQICGTVPLSALTGTNFVVAPPAAADYTLYYIGGFVVVIIVIALAIVIMRRPRKSP